MGLPHLAPPRPQTRRRWLWLSLVSAAAFLLSTAPAHAEGTAVTTCERSADHGCVQVNVFDDEREPIAGVTVTLTGPDGTPISATSTADGPTMFQVDTADVYSVSLDPETFPADSPAAGAQLSKELTVQFGSTARGTFDLSEAVAAPTSTASVAASESTPEAEPAAGTSGLSLDRVIQQLASGLRFGLMLALASVGASLIYGTTRVSNFAHGEQVTLGAVLSYLFVQFGLPLWAAAVAAIAVCAATGWLQDAAIWKPLRSRGTPVTQIMIVTIGLSIALQFLIQLLVGTGTFQVVTGNPRVISIGPVTWTFASLLAMGISLVVLLAVGFFLTRTRLGRATRAVSDNPALASATGINTASVIRLVWTLACGLAGLAGLMFALMFGAANWNMGLQMLLLMFAAITLGGLGTANGALVGSLIIGFAVELSSLVIPSDLRYATALLILIIVLLVRPQGILGRADRIG